MNLITKQDSVLFIGLGVMGFHMARHLANHYQTIVYNRSSDKAAMWNKSNKGTVLDSLDNIPRDVKAIITCIGKDSDLEQVYLGQNGLFENSPSGTLFIDHTTASAQIAQRLYSIASENGHEFIDAPVSGGEQGAINGQLTTMCGGDNSAYERATPIMKTYSRAINLMGPSGSGQMTKMANQIAVAGVVQGLSEAIHFSQQAGLNCQQVINVISKGAAQSWQMENRSETMINDMYDHGFVVDLMRKDLDIVLSEARNIDATLPITALIDQFYAEIQNIGGGSWDTSSLLKRLQKKK